MRISFALFPFTAFLGLASCNVAKKMEHATTKSFAKSELVAHTFTDAGGPHKVWSSAALSTNKKPKLMLVHGIMSSSGMWAGDVGRLSDDYDLIVPDLIGHGGSTGQWSGNSVEAQISHLVGILDSLGVREPVFVVGNSYGGAIVANLAEKHPERVRVLVIGDGPASDYTAAMADSVARSVGAKDITALFTPTNNDEQYRLMSLVFFDPPKIPGFALKQMNQNMAKQRAGHLALLQDLLKRESEYATKKYRWTMPTYVLWGEGDRLIPLSTGRGIMRRNNLPADHLIIIPKAGHGPNLEQPKVFAKELKRILK